MRKIIFFSCLLLVGVLWLGCKSTVTNISVTKYTRNPTNLYPVEAVLDVRLQAIRMRSVNCTAIVGLEHYPLRRVKNLDNRWEGLIFVPADMKAVDYWFKFDYEENAFGAPKKGTHNSPVYRMELRDQ